MTRRRSRPLGRAGAVLLGALLAACGAFEPAPTPPPAPTPRPAPLDVEPWPDLAWRIEEFRADDVGAHSSRLVAVAGGPAGVVAVGEETADIGDRGFVVHAAGGAGFERVDDPIFAGWVPTAVAAADPGYVIVGTELGENPVGPRVVVVASADGRTWQRLAPAPAFDDAYATGVAAGPGGFVAWGFAEDADAGGRIWRSPDGRSWTAMSAGELGLAEVAVQWIGATGAGWTATGRADGRPVVAASPDGLHWQVDALPSRPGDDPRRTVVDRMVVGPWGRLAVGSVGDDCGFLWLEGDCGGRQAAWWSDGSGAWAELIEPIVRVPGGGLAVAGERGFVHVDGQGAEASLDGLDWRPLPGGAGLDASANAVIVVGDRIVAVGERFFENGSSRGWIAVGAPEGGVERP